MEKAKIKKTAPDSSIVCRRVVSSMQHGIVLIVTLLALIAMMLVSVGIMRSVDTSVLAVGNMAFRQSAEATANCAIETVFRDLISNAQLQNGGEHSDQSGNHYFAAYNPANDDARGTPIGRLNAQATEAGCGNSTRVVIERMCTAAGAPNPLVVACLTTGGGPGAENSINKGGEDQDELNDSGGGASAGGQILYRISVRVDGPNGTTAFAQAMVDRS